ncbi:P-loop containing nucleoside triphosphate hydrolase protein [Ochromonadaceae sp. CCMP2298]|nr:P-loop containing nucleoside triphosphate hydrolase protein [Ochromonadaceae sp. CCMP2298]
MGDHSEALQVFVRVRPPIFKEVTLNTAVTVNGSRALTLSDEKRETRCSYDHVFNELSQQEEVFEKVKPLLIDVLTGRNSCIFAYGQTSAGKSYTMIGPNGGQDLFRRSPSEWGILPRASEFLLGYLNEKSQEGGLSYAVKASFLQIYNETLYDLLKDSNSGPTVDEKQHLGGGGGKVSHDELRIREVPSKKGGGGAEVWVSGLSEYRVQTAEDILKVLAVGANNRMTRSTDFNETSSRSHALLQLTFEIETSNNGQRVINRSKLSLVDLAGSEKIPLSEFNAANAKHMRELTSINKSLSSLGNVIAALSSTRPHIPYRDSKLTRILQNTYVTE